MKTILKVVMAIIMSAALIIVPTVNSNAMTKKQVNSEISSLQKKVKKDKSAYNKALKNDQDKLNSYFKVDGTLYSPKPNVIVRIVGDKPENDKYLCFKNYDNLTVIQESSGATKRVTGLAVVSDKTMDFYGTTVYEDTAKETPHEASDKQASIKKNQARIKSLKNSKKESVRLDKVYTIHTGESLTVQPVFKYNTANINVISWKSSNKKIVKVSKNGTLLGISPGTATVSAKLSVTGKTYRTTVNVIAQ